MSLTTAIIPLIIGLTLGLLGGGGSVLAVPALVYIFGLEAKTAIAISLLVVGLSAIIGAFSHGHRERIPYKELIPFFISGMLGSFLSAKFLAPLCSNSLQLIIFAVMVIVISVYMFTKKEAKDIDDDSNKKANYLLVVLTGLLLGSITGLIGVGGGFLIVPALVFFMRMHLHTAIASSLIVIALQALTGFIGYIDHINVDYSFIAIFSAIFFLGSFIGAKLSAKVPVEILNKAFAVILFLIGFLVVFKEF